MKKLEFKADKILIMGILNITPDSFSDGGKFIKPDAALKQAEQMLKEGADILDVGGESTRPFSDPVSLVEELDRTIPVIERISKEFDAFISIDTYKSQVAEEALIHGASMINDISGFIFDPAMMTVAKKFKPVCVIMHSKGKPKDMQVDPYYVDVVAEIYDFLSERIRTFKQEGLNDIIIDVGFGFGFGKNLTDNYKLLKELNKFQELGCPVLAGISRKSMIGKVIPTEPVERLPGTIALNTAAVLNGARILRVHDVKEHFQAVKTLEVYLATK